MKILDDRKMEKKNQLKLLFILITPQLLNFCDKSNFLFQNSNWSDKFEKFISYTIPNFWSHEVKKKNTVKYDKTSMQKNICKYEYIPM